LHWDWHPALWSDQHRHRWSRISILHWGPLLLRYESIYPVNTRIPLTLDVILHPQLNSNDLRQKTCTVTQTVSYMRTANRARMPLTESSLKSTESMSSFYRCFVILNDFWRLISIDKKSKFSRKRNNEDEGDITYINEHNRVFNKKVSLSLVSCVLSLS
jgi:hypothetical protein